jgi:hypothetical protein
LLFAFALSFRRAKNPFDGEDMLMSKGRALLRKIEQEVQAEGREFMRKRMAEKLAELDRRDGGLFPPRAAETGARESAEVETADAQRTD